MAIVITTILFDLDQTLYVPASGLLAAGDCKITDFLARRLELPAEEADAVRQRLWRQYGTTARGGEIEFGISQAELYEESVEGIEPAEYLGADEPLARMLEGLEAELYVVTNAHAGYAHKVLKALAIDHCFEAVFDIEALRWCPKPEGAAYECVVEALDRDPRELAMVEDFPWNLVPAHELGMFTVYLETGSSHVTETEVAEADLRLTDLLKLPEALKAAGVVLRRPG